MKAINYKYLMFECDTYKPTLDFAFNLNCNGGFYLHFAFIFFYFQIDIDRDNKEVNEYREARRERLNNIKK